MNGLEVGFDNENQDPGSLLRHWLDLGSSGEGCMTAGRQDCPRKGSAIQESRDIVIQGSESAERRDAGISYHCTGRSRDVNSIVEDGQTATVHREIQKGHIEMAKKLLEKGSNVNKPDARGWTPKTLAEQGNKNIYDLILSYENRRPAGEHRIDIGPEKAHSWDDKRKYGRNEGPHNSKSHLQKLYSNSSSSNSKDSRDRETVKVNKKRVTIRMKSQSKGIQGQQKPLGKLIFLPDSIDELLRLAGKLY